MHLYLYLLLILSFMIRKMSSLEIMQVMLRININFYINIAIIQVKKLTELAIIPKRGSEFAAGFDLSSAYDVVVPARGKALVKTDIAIAIPPNTYARIGITYFISIEYHLLPII